MTRRLFGSLTTALIAASLLAGGAPASAASSGVPHAAVTPGGTPEPSVRLITSEKTVEVTRFPGQPIYVDPGVYLAAVGGTFQVNAWRADYDHPVQAAQIVQSGGTTSVRPLPDGMVTSLNGLDHFFHVIVWDSHGQKVASQSIPFCPAGTDQRINDLGPANPTFPRNCFNGPFTLGSVFGIDRGWAIAALGYTGITFDGKNGRYHLRLSISDAYRQFFGISEADGSTDVTLNVTKQTNTCLPECPPHPGATGKSAGAPNASASRGLTAAPAYTTPTGPCWAPCLLPDLIALPAWSADIATTDGHDYLEFAATVWDKGPGSLDVEGFRTKDEPNMQAWQYFYDAEGNVSGKASVGKFHYDSDPGHEHWHFQQFARYSLLDANQQRVVLSQKDGFCLAPTDAIDMTVPGALWNPASTGLATACGGPSAIWVREVLPTGWGDTYVQSLPGQSFDITNLPNGTYFVSVQANPDHALYESDYTNDTQLRQIRLSGTAGHRRVQVSPWHGISA